MRIAVLEREGRVLAQCEPSAQVALVDIDPVSHCVQRTTFLTPPPQAGAELATWLCQQQVDVVLTNGLPRRDCDLLEQKGIRVVVGVPPFRVEPVVASFLAGTLKTGDNPCEPSTGNRA